MSVASVNGIDISYAIHARQGANGKSETRWAVLINGLADEKESWAYQVEDLVSSGYRLLTFDNRGIGKTSARK